MKIFLDTADVDEISKAHETGMINGITTNPTLIMKSGRDPIEVIKEMSGKFKQFESISAEVVADTAEEMIDQAKAFEGLKACLALSIAGHKVNVTLVFSVAQAILASKAGAAYVSPFVGRLNDNSFSGIALIQDIARVYERQFTTTQILAASVRDVSQVSQCFDVGANVCTLPPKVFWGMYNHILTDKGLELFNRDWAAVHGTN